LEAIEKRWEKLDKNKGTKGEKKKCMYRCTKKESVRSIFTCRSQERSHMQASSSLEEVRMGEALRKKYNELKFLKKKYNKKKIRT
jgi:hypothetical protein